MKRLVFPILFINLMVAANAQDNTNGRIQKSPEKYQFKYPGKLITPGNAMAPNLSSSRINIDSLIFRVRTENERRKAERIKYLKQDNMPCVVPDTKDIAAIPNAARTITVPFPTTIPNPAQKETPIK